MEQKTAIKPPVEVRYQEELEFLSILDTGLEKEIILNEVAELAK